MRGEWYKGGREGREVKRKGKCGWGRERAKWFGEKREEGFDKERVKRLKEGREAKRGRE